MITVLLQRALKYGFREILGLEKRVGQNLPLDQYYFAYGANLSEERLKKFNIKAERVGVAELKGHTLTFAMPCEYKGKGYASITPSADDSVWGIVFKINREGLLMLDILEWLPFGFYERKLVEISLNDGQVLAGVNVYIAKYPKEGLIPSRGYRDYVLKEAEACHFPEGYLNKIRDTAVGDDFELDPGFCLSNPSKRRPYENLLSDIYLKHDQLREKLTKVIP